MNSDILNFLLDSEKAPSFFCRLLPPTILCIYPFPPFLSNRLFSILPYMHLSFHLWITFSEAVPKLAFLVLLSCKTSRRYLTLSALHLDCKGQLEPSSMWGASADSWSHPSNVPSGYKASQWVSLASPSQPLRICLKPSPLSKFHIFTQMCQRHPHTHHA